MEDGLDGVGVVVASGVGLDWLEEEDGVWFMVMVISFVTCREGFEGCRENAGGGGVAPAVNRF